MDGRAPHRTLDGDLEGLDESQRTELHSYEGGGPSDGLVLTDLTRDRGEDYVEDDTPSEILGGDPEELGLSVMSPDQIGDGDSDDAASDDEAR